MQARRGGSGSPLAGRAAVWRYTSLWKASLTCFLGEGDGSTPTCPCPSPVTSNSPPFPVQPPDLLLHSALVQETAYIEDRPLHMLYCAAEENCLASSARSANWPYGPPASAQILSQIHNLGRADSSPRLGATLGVA